MCMHVYVDISLYLQLVLVNVLQICYSHEESGFVGWELGIGLRFQ